jgi:hypothetical protein
MLSELRRRTRVLEICKIVYSLFILTLEPVSVLCNLRLLPCTESILYRTKIQRSFCIQIAVVTTNEKFVLYAGTSVGDPDPESDPDPHVFGPSVSGSISLRYGFRSGSRSFSQGSIFWSKTDIYFSPPPPLGNLYFFPKKTA